MDSLINAAARLLASGDALGALNYIAWRDDPQALALRGIAMAQLGDLNRAQLLLRRAARAFGSRQDIARARCTLAQAEIALVSRDLNWSVKALDTAADALARHGDHVNAAHACYLKARSLLLVGRLDQVESALAGFDPAPLPPASRAGLELVVAGVAMRRLRIEAARAALARAEVAARQAGIPSILAEVQAATLPLDTPAARLIAGGKERALRLADVEKLLTSKTLVVDACRHVVSHSGSVISLETRPILFVLARALAEAWPDDVARTALLARAFRVKHADASHRARLRVEMGRLRVVLRAAASVEATQAGFRIVPRRAGDVVVLAPPTDEAHAMVLALLGDGESWSSSALSLSLGVSARTVQRALVDLTTAGKLLTIGRGRARRWMTAPVPGFPIALLLPATLPGG
ncbi:MAG TPA: hypothetical protein VHY19_04705 [Steroidobacteraceae bacterium]|nr:hypothetical protein [Steroidobacteraceae bacterium]